MQAPVLMNGGILLEAYVPPKSTGQQGVPEDHSIEDAPQSPGVLLMSHGGAWVFSHPVLDQACSGGVP